MNPKLIFQLIREVSEMLINEEKREKVAITFCVCIATVVLLLSFIYYIVSSPFQALANIIGLDNEEQLAILQDFKEEYRQEVIIYEEREIPLFFQFDPLWANYPYAGTTIKVAGCGPSSLAMVVAGLTGNSSVTPQTMAEFSESRGWAIDGVGTSWELMTSGAREFGLDAVQVSTSVESIVSNLSSGKVMITSMTPGTFTTGGHFIVLTGLTEDGLIKVNDSYSERLSNTVFSPELISNECKGAWAFSIPEDEED